jgi:hypothetical protein
MKDTISHKLFKTLQKGKDKLDTEALGKISCFVRSQQTAEQSFMNKNGISDLYYTSFGWMLAYILNIRLDHKKTDCYLKEQDMNSPDLIHYAAYMRCKMINRLMKKGKAGLLFSSLLPGSIKDLKGFSHIPHDDPQSPYTQFIWLSLLEDTGHRIEKKEYILNSLTKYHLPDGGYMNTQDGLNATTNATAAALAVKGQLTGYKRNEDLLYLYELQDESGGFSAAAASPVPDLLSTATALFILGCYGVKIKYPAQDFIEAHWLDSGGFSATLIEDKSDIEYTFYGLLAVGAI